MPSRKLRSLLAAAAGSFAAVVLVWVAALLWFPDTAYEKVLTVMIVAAPAGAAAAWGIIRRVANRPPPLAVLALTVLSIASSCALSSPMQRTDIAIIEAGEAYIRRIDGAVIHQENNASFEIRPGPHTVDVTAMAIRPHVLYTTTYQSGLVSLCLKARGGRRYRIKTKVVNDRLQAYVIDASTGEPPKTPCGPDESDD